MHEDKDRKTYYIKKGVLFSKNHPDLSSIFFEKKFYAQKDFHNVQHFNFHLLAYSILSHLKIIYTNICIFI